MNVNTPAQPLSGNMDVDEFMAFMETRPKGEHWDLIEGVAVMMAPASYAHQRIAYNLCNLLNSAFAARPMESLSAAMIGIVDQSLDQFAYSIISRVSIRGSSQGQPHLSSAHAHPAPHPSGLPVARHGPRPPRAA